MYAQKTILNTDKTGKPVKWPELPPNAYFEVIFLELTDDTARKAHKAIRHPHPDIAGSMEIAGNIIDTVPQSQWNLSE